MRRTGPARNEIIPELFDLGCLIAFLNARKAASASSRGRNTATPPHTQDVQTEASAGPLTNVRPNRRPFLEEQDEQTPSVPAPTEVSASSIEPSLLEQDQSAQSKSRKREMVHDSSPDLDPPPAASPKRRRIHLSPEVASQPEHAPITAVEEPEQIAPESVEEAHPAALVKPDEINNTLEFVATKVSIVSSEKVPSSTEMDVDELEGDPDMATLADPQILAQSQREMTPPAQAIPPRMSPLRTLLSSNSPILDKFIYNKPIPTKSTFIASCMSASSTRTASPRSRPEPKQPPTAPDDATNTSLSQPATERIRAWPKEAPGNTLAQTPSPPIKRSPQRQLIQPDSDEEDVPVALPSVVTIPPSPVTRADQKPPDPPESHSLARSASASSCTSEIDKALEGLDDALAEFEREDLASQKRLAYQSLQPLSCLTAADTASTEPPLAAVRLGNLVRFTTGTRQRNFVDGGQPQAPLSTSLFAAVKIPLTVGPFREYTFNWPPTPAQPANRLIKPAPTAYMMPSFNVRHIQAPYVMAVHPKRLCPPTCKICSQYRQRALIEQHTVSSQAAQANQPGPAFQAQQAMIRQNIETTSASPSTAAGYQSWPARPSIPEDVSQPLPARQAFPPTAALALNPGPTHVSQPVIRSSSGSRRLMPVQDVAATSGSSSSAQKPTQQAEGRSSTVMHPPVPSASFDAQPASSAKRWTGPFPHTNGKIFHAPSIRYDCKAITLPRLAATQQPGIDKFAGLRDFFATSAWLKVSARVKMVLSEALPRSTTCKVQPHSPKLR